MRAVEFDMSEILRISEKKRDLGEDALTDEELYMHAGFNALAKPLILGRTEQQRADRARGSRSSRASQPNSRRSTTTGHPNNSKRCGLSCRTKRKTSRRPMPERDQPCPLRPLGTAGRGS
jgi:hypothetical protein